MAINVNHAAKLSQVQQIINAFGARTDERYRKSADKIAKTDLATALSDEITASTTGLSTLVGSDSNKSVRAIAAEELAAKLIPADAKEALNTLEEIAAWIQNHPDEAGAINAKLTLGTHEVEGEQKQYATVKDYVEAYVAAQCDAVTLSGSNAIDVTNKVISLIVDAANANGLEITASGLKLKTVTASANGVGGSAGAMTAADKEKLDGIEFATSSEVQEVIDGLFAETE